MPEKSDTFYITTAIDYVNDVIHLGHAFQKVAADILARYHRLSLGNDNVFFLTGTDEYGHKAEKAAKDADMSPAEFVAAIAESDEKEQGALGVSFNRFIRTTDEDHTRVAQEIWKRVEKSGDIYLGEFSGLYCVGCEAYYTSEELVDGKCPLHPTLQIQEVTEKNFFFRWSKYQDFLIGYLQDHSDFVYPESRQHEVLEFAKRGIRDIPVSRTSFHWGVPVPGHPDHVMYVWFDALTNYLTGVGFLDAPQTFEKFWPADIHLLGKDNVRWHALLWPAMLKSAGLELPKKILVNGFLMIDGQKISKSIGNVIRPSDWVEKFGADVVRYYLMRYTTLTEDGDVSEIKLRQAYEADLAKGLGNFLARVVRLGEEYQKEAFRPENLSGISEKIEAHWQEYHRYMENFALHEALKTIWALIKEGDQLVDSSKLWELAKNDQEKFHEVLGELALMLGTVSSMLQPFMPETSEKIDAQLGIDTSSKEAWTFKFQKGDNLFPALPV